MFEIKYRIVDYLEHLKDMDAKKFDSDSIIEGFILLNFNGNKQGYYHDRELKQGEQGFENLTTWFELLVEVVIRLKYRKYILLDVIESYNTLLEFKKEQDLLFVSEILDENKSGDAIKETITKSVIYGDFQNAKISYLEFRSKICDAVNHFIEELNLINHKILDSKTIFNLKTKIQNLLN
jgi:hypothetical protein